MRVNFSVISVLNSEDKTDSFALDGNIIKTKITRRHLETVEQVPRRFVSLCVVHTIFEVSHFEFTILVHGHESLFNKDRLIKELFFSREFLK